MSPENQTAAMARFKHRSCGAKASRTRSTAGVKAKDFVHRFLSVGRPMGDPRGDPLRSLGGLEAFYNSGSKRLGVHSPGCCAHVTYQGARCERKTRHRSRTARKRRCSSRTLFRSWSEINCAARRYFDEDGTGSLSPSLMPAHKRKRTAPRRREGPPKKKIKKPPPTTPKKQSLARPPSATSALKRVELRGREPLTFLLRCIHWVVGVIDDAGQVEFPTLAAKPNTLGAEVATAICDPFSINTHLSCDPWEGRDRMSRKYEAPLVSSRALVWPQEAPSSPLDLCPTKFLSHSVWPNQYH